MNYKIINGKVLRYTNNNFIITNECIYVKNNLINKIVDTNDINKSEIDDIEGSDNYEVVDAKGKLIMPGLINMHTHVYMNFLKNYADDVPFSTWLFDKIQPVEDKINASDAYLSSLLGCCEMIKSGTTCYLDMHIFGNQSCDAANKVGMRAFVGRGLVGEDLDSDGKSRFDETMNEAEKYKECDNLGFVLSPHAIYSCSDKLLCQINEKSKELSMLKHIHLAESDFEQEECLKKNNCTPAEHLNNLNFLDDSTILAHCVKLNDKDIEIIKNRNANVVTNPASNAKLGNGCAPVAKMLKAGINVCLGTDSAASNNTLNMFREMGILTMVQKADNKDCEVLPARDILKMATLNGAKALGMENKIGNIIEGAYADLIFLDLSSPSLFPNNNIITSLVYSANGSEIDDVMINGEFVMKDRKMINVNEEELHNKINEICNTYLELDK